MSLERLLATIHKDSRLIIGLISGMSMDGVDLALVRIRGAFPDLDVELLDSDGAKYDPSIRAQLMAARTGTTNDVCETNFVVARVFAGCVRDFLAKRGMDPSEVDAIGSHGQSICHVPRGADGLPSTLQIGAGSMIAELTGIPTVSNFRVRDMSVGGEGAPLIPLVDYILYRQPDQIRALNNLGSISNVTVVTPKLDDMIAFDTGPANMPIDFFAALVPGNASNIDEDGALSGRGRVQEDALAEWLSIPFLDQPPPKAAGYDEFGPVVLTTWADRYADREPIDLLRTAVEFSARTIADAYTRFVLPKFSLDAILFTGGGAYNKTLLDRIRRFLPDVDIRSEGERDKRYNDAKEALGFALLANETLSGRPGNVPGATGADRPVVLGEIAP